MRLYELFLDEKINVSHHEDEIENSIKKSILYSLEYMITSSPLSRDKKAIAELEDGSGSKYFTLLEEDLPNAIAGRISFDIIDVVDKINPDIHGIHFKDMKVGGYAQGLSIYVNKEYITKMSKTIVNNISEMVYSAYNDNERISGLKRFVREAIEHPDGYISKEILNNIDSNLDYISGTIIHEIVHATQHDKQFKAGRQDLEYRSYLGKKGEFQDLHNKMGLDAWSANNPDSTKEKYHKLYYASPQEMAAHAHNVALQIIKDSIKYYTDPESYSLNDFDAMAKEASSAQMISEYLKPYLMNRYSKNIPKEHNVYKRYAKLVYQELKHYINQKRQNFIKKD